MLPPAARPWECGSSGPDLLAQLVADRCGLPGVWTPGVTIAGGLEGFLGSGMHKVAESGEGHSTGLDVPGHRAPLGPWPGEASCA